MARFILIVFFLALLAACQTSRNYDDNSSHKIRAAKINVRLGMAYLERNDTPRAKQKLLLAMEQAPQLPETWYAMGYFEESTGNKQKASEFYLKSLSLAPKRGDALNNYGTYLCRNGDYVNSIRYFLQATQDTNYLGAASAYENAGLCALKAHDRAGATNYFLKALAQDSSRATSRLKLAELYYQSGKRALARAELRQYLEANPPTAETYVLERKIDA